MTPHFFLFLCLMAAIFRFIYCLGRLGRMSYEEARRPREAFFWGSFSMIGIIVLTFWDVLT